MTTFLKIISFLLLVLSVRATDETIGCSEHQTECSECIKMNGCKFFKANSTCEGRTLCNSSEPSAEFENCGYQVVNTCPLKASAKPKDSGTNQSDGDPKDNSTTASDTTNTPTAPTASTAPTSPTSPTASTAPTSPTASTAPTTPTTASPVTTASMPSPSESSVNVSSEATTQPTTETSTAKSSTSTDPPQNDRRQFDAPSFVGGIVLSLGLLAIAYVGYKFYRARTEHNYHTL